MKRKDFIDKVIMKWMYDCIPDEYSKHTSYINRIKATELLDRIEDEGMLPPCGCTLNEYGNGCSNFDHNNTWDDDE